MLRWLATVHTEAKAPSFHRHNLRHTYISRLVMEHVNLRMVHEMAGHKTISITNCNAHLTPERNQATIDRPDPAA
jgi:site-specific recombinase XerD